MKTLTQTCLKPLFITATLLAGSTLVAHAATPAATPAEKPAAESAQPPGHGSRHSAEHCADQGGPGHGGRHHRKAGFDRGGMRGQHGVLAMGELRGLELSDAQRTNVRAVLVKNRQQQRSLNERERELDRSFDALDPTAKDYKARTQGLADQAGKLARDRVAAQTALRAQIYAELTPEQVKQLQTRREERAARRAEFEKRRQERQDEAPKKAS